MAENINLLPQQNDENAPQTRQRKVINQISIVVLAVSIFAVIALFAGQFVLGQQLNGIEEEIQTQQARIQAKKTEEGIQRSLINRIHALDSFFSTQNNYSQFIEALGKTYPATLKLNDMDVNDEMLVSLTGSVASYADLAGFYAKLSMSGAPSGSTSGTDFVDPMLTTITRNNDSGAIDFSMQMSINPTLLQAEAANGEQS